MKNILFILAGASLLCGCASTQRPKLSHAARRKPLNETKNMITETPILNGKEQAALCSSAVLADSPTWPHVFAFALRMESKLAKNRHKGDREGWLKDHPWNLVERILDETVELQQCFEQRGALMTELTDVVMVKTPEETANECADVANFCMMVADSVTKSANNTPSSLIPTLPEQRS